MSQQTGERCLWCGNRVQVVWVHGHGQCGHCGLNIAPCCDGGMCDAEPAFTGEGLAAK